MEIKVVTYNIDGLPTKLDLKDLPWFLKPVTWIYKLIKGTTEVVINDNDNKEECMDLIGRYLKNSKADIIGVQEDFNYHEQLAHYLEDYTQGTYTGGMDLKGNIKWLPYPRFKADGLGLFAKSGIIKEEKIVTWNKSYGYFKHANDKLTQKGFRFYTINIDKVNVDVYILHMDADFYNPDTCPNVSKDVEARGSQLRQLSDFIKDRYLSGFNNPIIIMGDTNSSPDYQWDIDNIQENLITPIKGLPMTDICEVVPDNARDVDRIFIINTVCSEYILVLSKCSYDLAFGKGDGKPSDHWVLSATFTIKKAFWDYE